MEADRLSIVIRSIATAVAIVGGAFLLVLWFGAARYERELIVNLPALAFLALVFAIPGGVLFVVASIQAVQRSTIPNWSLLSLLGAVLASGACIALAYAANCVPQCEGRGSLQGGLMLAAPAGFAAGALCFGIWALSKHLIRLLRPNEQWGR